MQHYQNHIIVDIIAKYPFITPEQEAILHEWMEKNGNRQWFDSLVDAEFRRTLLARYDAMKNEEPVHWEKLSGKINTVPEQIEMVPAQRRMAWWRRTPVLAAASVLFIILLSVFFLLDKKETHVPNTTAKTVAVVHDVAPGTFRAKLKLANGAEVVLDNATGEITLQGGTKVINKDGQLVYEQGKDAKEVLYNTLFTSKGESYATVLADGSKVWLNSQSSIRYPVSFSGNERRVEITGEAYFEVAHNAAKPFHVMVNGSDIQVLGTHFNVNAYNDEPSLKTTLIQGKVKVTKNNAVVVLKPGEQAQVDESQIDVDHHANVDEAIAWHNGFFQFNNADLETILRQLVRWYDVQVSYQGKMQKHGFSGEIPRDMNLSQVLSILEKQGVHFSIEGKKIIVTP